MCVVMFLLFPVHQHCYIFIRKCICVHTHSPYIHVYTHVCTHAHTHTYTHTLTLSLLRTHSLSLTHTHAREHFLESAAIYSKNQGEDDEETQDVRVCAEQYSEWQLERERDRYAQRARTSTCTHLIYTHMRLHAAESAKWRGTQLIRLERCA